MTLLYMKGCFICRLFSGVVSMTEVMQHQMRCGYNHKLSVGRDLEAYNRHLFEGICLDGLRKRIEMLVRTASTPAEIQMRYLPNAGMSLLS
jgi:hypothetical protein